VWVAERDGEIIGFCNTVPATEELAGTAELQTLYLAPEVVGTGKGAALIRCALNDLRARGYGAAVLWVLDTNARARRFYEKGGWQADGTEKTEQLWGITVREVRYRIALTESGAR
ncbi:MAG TPA: GNAT family N-acetyltransferase, partial [Chloroflexota bacterium]|nr:GNAT family N-acetyltransferase [Chloroflexota bacterium]